MSQGDKALRVKAVPFTANPYANPSVPTADYASLTNLSNPTLTTRLTKTIPLSRPQKGDIVEAFLFMRMIAPSDKALNVRIGIGTMTSHQPTVSYDEGFVAREHLKLTGQSTPFNVAANGTLVIEVNLLPSLFKRGDSGFYQEGFALIVTFDSLPAVANGYLLSKFSVNCTAQIGLNR